MAQTASRPTFVQYHEVKEQVGERMGKPIIQRVFHLVDSEGVAHPAARGQNTGSNDGHYVYRSNLQGYEVVSCTSRRALISWLCGVIQGSSGALAAGSTGAEPVHPVSTLKLSTPLAAVQPSTLQLGQSMLSSAGTPPVLPYLLPGPAVMQQGGSTAQPLAMAPGRVQLQFALGPSGGLTPAGPPAPAAAPYVSYRRDRSMGGDGLRRINYVLLKADGEEDLAAVAREVKSSGGHYSYQAGPKFGPRTWKNGAEVRRWLAELAPQGDRSAPEHSVHNPVQLQRQLQTAARGEAVPPRQPVKAGGQGLVKDADKRAALIARSLDLVQTKLDLLNRRAGVQYTLTLVGLGSNTDVQVIASNGIPMHTPPPAVQSTPTPKRGRKRKSEAPAEEEQPALSPEPEPELPQPEPEVQPEPEPGPALGSQPQQAARPSMEAAADAAQPSAGMTAAAQAPAPSPLLGLDPAGLSGPITQAAPPLSSPFPTELQLAASRALPAVDTGGRQPEPQAPAARLVLAGGGPLSMQPSSSPADGAPPALPGRLPPGTAPGVLPSASSGTPLGGSVVSLGGLLQFSSNYAPVGHPGPRSVQQPSPPKPSPPVELPQA